MTREETIIVLKQELAYLNGGPSPIFADYEEAVQTALAALREQETVTNRNGLTNADHIRSMTDEELGLFLGEWAERHLCCMCDGTGETLHWLKQPYKEAPNDPT